MSFAPGTPVKARGREWVVLPESVADFLVVRPLGGTLQETAGILTDLELVTPATFSPPGQNDLGDFVSCRPTRTATGSPPPARLRPTWPASSRASPRARDAFAEGVETPQADSDPTHTPPWARKLSRLLARRRFADAMRYLDRVIDQDYPLFAESAETLADRRMVWLCRIDLLREQGRIVEALAWTCLECEMNPGNVTAQALKERLKRRLKLTQQAERQSKAPSQQSDGWEGVAGMWELKAVLDRDIMLPLQEPELYRKYRVGVPNGVLLAVLFLQGGHYSEVVAMAKKNTPNVLPRADSDPATAKAARLLEIAAKVRQVPGSFGEETRDLLHRGWIALGRLTCEAYEAGAWQRDANLRTPD